MRKTALLILLSYIVTYSQAQSISNDLSSDEVPVIFTAGQSNADGRVPIDDFPSDIRYEYCRWSYGSGDFRVATGDFTPFWPMVAHVTNGQRWGFDAIVYHMLEQEWKRPFYVIKQTMGGTAIDYVLQSSTHGWYWSADSVILHSGKSLLKAFTQQVDDCLSNLPGNYVIKCLLWHQGESDRHRGTHYYDNLRAVIKHVRQHLVDVTGDVRYETLPVICGTYAINSKQRSNDVVDALYAIEREDKNFHVVDASDLTLLSDSLHFDAQGAQTLGERVFSKLKELRLTE